jgi:hypothetical protein
VAFAEFPFAGVEDGVHGLGHSYIGGIVRGEAVPQFPDAAEQGEMGVSPVGADRLEGPGMVGGCGDRALRGGLCPELLDWMIQCVIGTSSPLRYGQSNGFRRSCR